MFFSDIAALNASAFALLAVIVILQAAMPWISGKKAGSILSFVNPALHIGMVFLFMFAGTEFDRAVLAFMISLMTLVVSESVFYKRRGKGEGK